MLCCSITNGRMENRGTANLGSAYSAPSVAYNPANDLPVITVEGPNNSLSYVYQQSGTSWGTGNLVSGYSAPRLPTTQPTISQ